MICLYFGFLWQEVNIQVVIIGHRNLNFFVVVEGNIAKKGFFFAMGSQ